MKVFVKTLKGTNFEIDVNPEDTIADVKKNIETSKGSNVYPAEQLVLIHQGKIMKDTSTLAENNVAENNFLVVMLSKAKAAPSGSSSSNVSSTVTEAPTTTSATPPPAPQAASSPLPPPTAPVQSVTAPAVAADTAREDTDPYSHAASNLVAGSKFEESIQHILDIGGGTWDRDTVIRALRAAYNNPERAIEYLYSGIPEQELARVTPPSQPVNPPQQRQPAAATGGPNANPLDLFPQGLPGMGSNTGAGNLDFLRNSPQFRALQAMVQANPQILQPMLQELGKQNPQLMRMIQEHQADFVRLLNEPAEGAEGNLLSQLASAMPQPQTVQVTPEEREAIERLEAMGFDRALVLEVFFACNKNEELAANYLLDHQHEFND